MRAAQRCYRKNAPPACYARRAIAKHRRRRGPRRPRQRHRLGSWDAQALLHQRATRVERRPCRVPLALIPLRFAHLPIVQALGTGARAVQTAIGAPVVLLGATKEATCVAQKLLANERVGVPTHHYGPGCPHGVQQTILAFGVLRGMAVMLGVGFGYPCPTYVPCLFAFLASADEETEMPRAQTSNPSITDVVLLLAMIMEFLHRFSY